MLDLEFLRERQPLLRKHVIYRFRSGYLKRQVRSRVSKLVESEGFDLWEADYDAIEAQVTGEGNLFLLRASSVQPMYLCNLAHFEEQKQRRDSLNSLLLGLSAEGSSRFFLLVPENSRALEHQTWEALTSASTYIEEPAVTQANLGQV